jgi:hypothetical protein
VSVAAVCCASTKARPCPALVKLLNRLGGGPWSYFGSHDFAPWVRNRKHAPGTFRDIDLRALPVEYLHRRVNQDLLVAK